MLLATSVRKARTRFTYTTKDYRLLTHDYLVCHANLFAAQTKHLALKTQNYHFYPDVGQTHHITSPNDNSHTHTHTLSLSLSLSLSATLYLDLGHIIAKVS